MSTRLNPRPVFVLALGAGILATAGCVTPLGPGFQFAARQAEVRVLSTQPDRIHIRVADQLENDGDRPLRFLEVRLPEGPALGEHGLRVRVDGAEVSPQPSSTIDTRMVREPFDPPWEEKAKREVVTEWDLLPDASSRGTVAASANGFFVADATALPVWQAPNGLFTRGKSTPEKELFTVIAPSDFRVLAPGKPQKPSAEGSLIARRFLIQPDRDFVPYVVAGRYQERIISSRQVNFRFWTFQPIAMPTAQGVAERLSSSLISLRDFFGPATAGNTKVRIAEAPAELPAEFGAPGGPGGASFPEGVLLGPRAFQQGLASEEVLQIGEYELARTWFGWRVRPRPEAQILLGRGVGLFGLVIAAEGRGPGERSRMVASLVQRYDEARAAAPDKRLMEPPESYSRAERISTGYRAALFFVALEDLCGHENIKAAFRDIISARAGSDAGYEELRAALESASGEDLAAMFRAWLIQPGIPEDFRKRYGAK